MSRQKSNRSKDCSANLGFEAKLCLAADKLRNNMDAAEYKHVILAFPGQLLDSTEIPICLGEKFGVARNCADN